MSIQACDVPEASGHQIVPSVSRLDTAVPLILNQLAFVFPARTNLFRTNGPAVPEVEINMAVQKKKRNQKSCRGDMTERPRVELS